MPKKAIPVSEQPVSSVEWVDRKTLKPNHYNPNAVAPPELDLLITSILEDGWTQPIVALEDGTIVDGYHRWTVSGDPRIRAKTGSLVPVVRVSLDKTHRMMSTIRHNRARGTHGILRMAEIVREMFSDGVPVPEIRDRLGMEEEEIERLLDRSGLPTKIHKQAAGAFNEGWVPQKG